MYLCKAIPDTGIGTVTDSRVSDDVYRFLKMWVACLNLGRFHFFRPSAFRGLFSEFSGPNQAFRGTSF